MIKIALKYALFSESYVYQIEFELAGTFNYGNSNN